MFPPARKVVRDIEVIQAALECGYGKRVDWTAMLVLNSTEAQELTNYLVARLGMLLACIRVDSKDARALREFYKKMESSEKTATSFLAGSIGAYIAARLWLKAVGERMEAFLHVGIYTKSIAGNASLVSYFSAAKNGQTTWLSPHRGSGMCLRARAVLSEVAGSVLRRACISFKECPTLGGRDNLQFPQLQLSACIRVSMPEKICS